MERKWKTPIFSLFENWGKAKMFHLSKVRNENLFYFDWLPVLSFRWMRALCLVQTATSLWRINIISLKWIWAMNLNELTRSMAKFRYKSQLCYYGNYFTGNFLTCYKALVVCGAKGKSALQKRMFRKRKKNTSNEYSISTCWYFIPKRAFLIAFL